MSKILHVKYKEEPKAMQFNFLLSFETRDIDLPRNQTLSSHEQAILL